MAYDNDIRRPGNGGINLDVVDSELSIQDTRYVKNGVRFNGKDGLSGVVRNMKGNTQVAATAMSYFSADAKVIGKCRDEKNDAIIVFVADATNGDAIYEYYPKTDTVTFIVKNSATFKLNFDKTKFIKGAYVIDGKLYWNDAYSGPRKINIQKGKDYTAGLTTGYSYMDTQTIDLIKYPPLERIEPYYDTDPTVNTNNLRGYLFQFRIAYIYDDGEISVASPISSVAIPNGTIDVNGNEIGSYNTDNVIKFIINSGHHTVSKISVYVRIGNTGDWENVETLDKKELGWGNYAHYTYSFYNNEITTGVDQNQINQLYHAVPLVSDYMGYLHTNQLLFAGNVDGYNNIDAVASFTPKLNDISETAIPGSSSSSYSYTIGTPFVAYKDYSYSAEYGWSDVMGILITGLDTLPSLNSVIDVVFFMFTFKSASFVASSGDSSSESIFATDLANFITANFQSGDVNNFTAHTSFLNESGVEQVPPNAILATYVTGPYQITPYLSVTSSASSSANGYYNSHPGFKQGATQSFGAVYYDAAGRSTFVQPLGKVYFPFLNEGLSLTSIVSSYSVGSNFEVSGVSPTLYAVLVSGLDTLPTEGNLLRITIGYWSGQFVVTAADIVSVLTFQMAICNFVTNSTSIKAYYSYVPVPGGSDIVPANSVIFLSNETFVNRVVTVEQWVGVATPSLASVYSVVCNINHLPPSWAYTYRIVRQLNITMTWFQRYIINGVTNGSTTTNDADKTYIDISPLNEHSLPMPSVTAEYTFPNSYISAYSWEKGDRIRFITETKSNFDPISGGGEGPGLGSVLPYFLDVEILGYKKTLSGGTYTDTNEIMVPLIDATTYPNLGQYTLVEIYRPNREKNDLLYYEMGDAFNVINSPDYPSTKIHSTVPCGQWQPIGTDQKLDSSGNIVNGASVEITDGDIYVSPMIFDMNLAPAGSTNRPVSLVESMSPSPFYKMESYNIGRTQIVDKNAKKQKLLSIRTGGKYFENSYINNLSQFYGGSDLYVSAEFGDTITGVAEVGFTLKIFQSRKVTSFFIGRTGLQLATASGSDTIMANSDAVISTQSPSPALRGCSNSESILVEGNLLFFVDVLNGSIVQAAQDGLVNVEMFGVEKDIKAICTSLLGYAGGYNIFSFYDPEWDMVGFSFQGINANGTIDDKGTYYYDYNYNKWSHVMTFGVSGTMPSFFATIDQYLVSFLGGNIWKHYTNSLYNNFYGTQQDMIVELVFNKNYGLTKLFKALELIGKGSWYSPTIGDVLIESKNAVNAIQQQSRLLSGRFEMIRGKQRAYFLKDAGTTNQQENLRTGNDLKGNILFLRLINKDTTEAVLDTASVTYQILGQ